jgi:PIN domain nuclease of toxin-antitoxin system
VKLLLDTHALLWTLDGDRRLPQRVLDRIDSAENDVYVSIASLWEAAIKIGNGKLRVPGQTIDYFVGHIQTRQLIVLALTLAPIRIVQTLPRHHRDPFDRILIAQSIAEGIPLVTTDTDIRKYKVDILW